MNLIGAILVFVLSPSSGSSCWFSLLTIGDSEWDWNEFYWSLSFYMPYLYFRKGGATLSVLYLFNGLVDKVLDNGEGEYFILLYEVELKVDENYLPIDEVEAKFV